MDPLFRSGPDGGVMEMLKTMVWAVMLVCCSVMPPPAGAAFLPAGSGEIRVDAGTPRTPMGMRLFYYRPRQAGPDAKILFVIHGARRNADRYRDIWTRHAEKYGFVVLAPEFSEDLFPGFWRFQMGNLYAATGRKKPVADSAFAALERIFDAVRGTYGFTAVHYDLFGHSAGGQFVHRMVLFGQARRARCVVAANAGTYSMPDETVPLPYGTGDAGLSPADYARAYAVDMVVMVGRNDDDPNHRSLSRNPEALAQGRHRLARGQLFFKKATAMAGRLGLTCRWRFVTVPGVGHHAAGMSAAAVGCFVAGIIQRPEAK